MSVMNTDSVKVILTRNGVDGVWKLLLDHYAYEDEIQWKRLAMLALREDADWPLDFIGLVFSHHKGHVQRSIEQMKREIREKFALSPEWRRRPLDGCEELKEVMSDG